MELAIVILVGVIGALLIGLGFLLQIMSGVGDAFGHFFGYHVQKGIEPHHISYFLSGAVIITDFVLIYIYFIEA